MTVYTADTGVIVAGSRYVHEAGQKGVIKPEQLTRCRLPINRASGPDGEGRQPCLICAASDDPPAPRSEEAPS